MFPIVSYNYFHMNTGQFLRLMPNVATLLSIIHVLSPAWFAFGVRLDDKSTYGCNNASK